MVYSTPVRRHVYRGTPRPITPMAAFTARRERANERSSARRRLNFQSPLAKSSVWGRSRNTTTAKIGFAPNTGTPLRRATVDIWKTTSGTVTIDPRVIIQDDLTDIPEKVAATTDISRRERAMINCLGFSLRIFVRNTLPSNSIVCRFAVVSPTDKNEISNAQFFRGYGTTRAQDFTTALDSHQYTDTPINTDNYSILWSYKCELGPDADTTGAANFSRSKANYMSINKFVKLNRQLRYDSNLGSACSDKIFLLMWYEGVGSTTTGPVAASSVIYQRYGITYWKDPGT